MPSLTTPTTMSPSTIDPHTLPSFSTDSVIQPSSTTLYLPPLLSSLPINYPESRAARIKNPTHLLTETRLPEIDSASLSLHHALHHFRPIRADYASTEYGKAFNWGELKLPIDDEREWYCVTFRSRRKEGSDNEPLYEADRLAHEEAVQNGGLIMYWYGVPDPSTRNNLATCIWQSRAHAIAAHSRPHHAHAAKLAASSYEEYSLNRFILRKERGSKGVSIHPYTGGPVGW